jgi:hypothetical protein
VNAALLKYDLSMSDLYEHWAEDRLSDAAPEEVTAYDQRFFASLEESQDIEVIGLDQAENAVTFAEQAGLLDEGLAVNLEADPLPAPSREDLAAVDLVTSTGCVGYVTEKTFDQLLPAVSPGRSPWLANFVLRIFPFDAIEETLRERGYVTEKLEDRTFVQRRFASAEEKERVLKQLRDQGIDPSGKETAGHLLAEFYLSRPASAASAAPLQSVIAA